MRPGAGLAAISALLQAGQSLTLTGEVRQQKNEPYQIKHMAWDTVTMTDEAKALVERLRWGEWYFEDPFDGKAYASDDPLDAANLIETQAREIERLKEVGAGAWVPAEQFVKLRNALEKATKFIGNTKHTKAGQKAYEAARAALGDSHDA